LSIKVGEALVGLYYFGDDESREIVEALLIESAREWIPKSP
jgi:hypothetical protein